MNELPDVETMLAENRRRNEALRRREAARTAEAAAPCGGDEMERLRSDFRYWARRCVTIRHKLTGRMVPFELNGPQLKVLEILEAQRLAGRPLRLIMLKARQWGGSTLIQMYMAWIQCVHRRNWNSFICAHVKDTSATIRGMYTRMLAAYPEELWEGGEAPQFKAFERSQNTRMIAGRDCLVTVGSCESQEAARGSDLAMAHLSEVAFWRDTTLHAPEDFVRSVCSGIPMEPLTMIALESTANGVGNFFHTAWLRAKAGESAFAPVFVPWHEIGIYRMDVADPAALVRSMDAYEHELWERGLTLEQIAWYHEKRREMSGHEAMMAEYPTDDIEAFVNSGASVFDRVAVERLRAGCSAPLMRGAVGCGDGHPRFAADPRGALEVWEEPAEGELYVATVDVGGRSDASDWSVISVMAASEERVRVVAQWRGHTDHDLLALTAVDLARWYGDALLVVESNTLEQGAASGGQALYLLEQINETYPNIYRRRVRDAANRPLESRIGFHTNVATKQLVIATLIAAVRDGAYLERDSRACDEMLTYERRPNGSYGARRGHHDDILMTRAIGLYVISTLSPDAADHACVPFLTGRVT